MTVIDHENSACLLIANVTSDHAGLWTCEIGNFALSNASLVLSLIGETERTVALA